MAAGRRSTGSFSTRTASVSDVTGQIRSPATTAASAAFGAGSSSVVAPCARAATAIGSTPRAAWMAPSSDSSPISTTSSTARHSTTPAAASTPSAIGRSKAAPAFRTSAGARLTVTRSDGNSNPQLRMAARTRSRLSRTLVSGSPTIVNIGSPNDTSTSTLTATASMPNTAAVLTQASIGGRACKRSDRHRAARLTGTRRKSLDVDDSRAGFAHRLRPAVRRNCAGRERTGERASGMSAAVAARRGGRVTRGGVVRYVMPLGGRSVSLAGGLPLPFVKIIRRSPALTRVLAR